MRLLRSRLRSLLAGLLACLAGLLVPGLAQAAGCAPAAVQGTAPDDFRSYCWLDFSGYVDSTARNGGQTLSFTLPDQTQISMLVVTTNSGITPKPVPSYSGAAFGNKAFNNIPGNPVLYTASNGGNPTVTISNIQVKPPGSSTASYSIVVADGESSNANETLAFTTTGNAWTEVARIANGTSTLYPTATGTNTRTVTLTGKDGTVGSYVYRSDGNPTGITVTMKGSGLQGFLIGMRYASVSVVSQIAGTLRYNAADQFNYSITTTAGTVLATGATSGTATTGFTPASVPTVAASYPFIVTQSMASGSVGTLANYSTTMSCANSSTASNPTPPVSQSGSSYQFGSLKYNDAVLCTFTNTPIFNQIVGTVYSDANHDNEQNGSEAGPGNGFYVKIAGSSNGVCTAPASQAVAVTASTGAYAIPNLPQGKYCVILDDNATTSDITPTLPTGWLGTENASGVLQVYVPAGATPLPQVFGIYNGARLTGTVFGDTGVGSGTPNNGSKDGAESGVNAVVVTARSGGNPVASATTTGDGSFTLWFPVGVTGAVDLAPTIPSGYLATGGGVGTTSGTFRRPNLSFTPVAGQTYTGVAFGLAVPSTFAPNGAQTAQAGMSVSYAHTFTAGSGGSVAFALATSSTPANAGWNAVLYQDTSCNAEMDAGEPLVSGPITVKAGEQVCLLVKQFVPAGIDFGAMGTATVTATFTYTNASPALSATLPVTDVTTAGEPQALSLKKQVTNVTKGGNIATSISASPGDVLLYTLTAQNNGATALTTLVINDATPAYTSFVSASCPATLPAGVTGCTLTQPAAGQPGAVQWSFAGALGGNGQVVVTYQVKLSQ